MSRPTQLDRLFLYHVWACVPFALVWMIWHRVVGVSQDPQEIRALSLVYMVGIAYLLVRSWLTFRPPGAVPWEYVWPLADVMLISAGLAVKGKSSCLALKS
jgi:hypothetical protein